MTPAGKLLITVTLLFALVFGASGVSGYAGSRAATTAEAPAPLAALEGRGLLDKLLCVGCIGAWAFVGGSGAGMIVAAVAFPELPGMCAYGCILAVTT